MSNPARRPDMAVSLATPRHALALCLIALSALLAFGCAESESSVEKCQTTNDCTQDDHVCFQGQCQHRDEARPCSTADECLPGEMCVSGFCGTPMGTDTMGGDMSMDDTSEDTGGMDTNTPQDTRPETLDMTPPTITARTPDDGDTGVALDATLSITFSEELITGTVTADSIQIGDPSNRRVDATVTYDPASSVATVEFTNGLQAWTQYEVTVTSDIKDLSMNSLVEVSWTFSTVGDDIATFHEELARAYAPLLHQDAGDTKRDMPVAIDFDGDNMPSNNLDNISQAAEPTVYYHVSETETHYFVHYILYYPSFKATSGATEQEHAVNGILVVVARDGSRLGHLEVFETYSVGYSPGQIDSWIPNCGGGDTQAFCPSAYSGTGAVIDTFHDVAAANYADADERRVKVYIRPYDHEVCAWSWENDGAGYCGHLSEQFFESTNAILSAADAGATPSVDFETAHTGTYALVHIAEPWWVLRDSVGPGTETFYANTTLYEPPSTAIGADLAQRLPTTLNTEDSTGNNGLFSPWGFATASGFGLEAGAWFVDPARAVSTRMNTSDPFESRADKYCYSLTFGVDRTEADAVCQHAN